MSEHFTIPEKEEWKSNEKIGKLSVMSSVFVCHFLTLYFIQSTIYIKIFYDFSQGQLRRNIQLNKIQNFSNFIKLLKQIHYLGLVEYFIT